jgi:anhydro-N-acetylmuramic acid kinase
MKKQIALGMMSGTSIDGSVSVAIVETDGDGFIRRMYADEYTYEDSGGLRPIHHVTKAAELAFRESNGDYAKAAKLYPDKLQSYIAATFALDGEALAAKCKELVEGFGALDGVSISLNEVIERSTEVHIEAAKQVLGKTGLSSKQIEIIGYHGQTLYHDPFFNRVTVQVGNAQRMADTLKVPVVFDFRQNDVRSGGQGAPLAPVYHRALLAVQQT